jgi:hypothetical protein
MCGKDFWRWKGQEQNPNYKLLYCSMLCKNRSPEQRLVVKNKILGDKNPMKITEIALKVSNISKEKYSKTRSEDLTKRWKEGKMPKPKPLTKEVCELISVRMKSNNPMYTEEVRNRVSLTNKKLFENPEYKLRILNSQRKYPNKLELKIDETLKFWGYEEFQYTGNRTFWIGPCKSGLARNPDFIDFKSKKVILVCGRHWHTEESIKIQVDDYNDKGYKVLVIWDNEFNKNLPLVIDKVEKFAELE